VSKFYEDARDAMIGAARRSRVSTRSTACWRWRWLRA
jgi:hypothetical protein